MSKRLWWILLNAHSVVYIVFWCEQELRCNKCRQAQKLHRHHFSKTWKFKLHSTKVDKLNMKWAHAEQNVLIAYEQCLQVYNIQLHSNVSYSNQKRFQNILPCKNYFGFLSYERKIKNSVKFTFWISREYTSATNATDRATLRCCSAVLFFLHIQRNQFKFIYLNCYFDFFLTAKVESFESKNTLFLPYS